MATWSEVKQYIHTNYQVDDEVEDSVKLVFDLGGSRSQLVIVWHLQVGGAEWLQIESPFGEIGSVDLTAALQAVGNAPVGGLALVGGRIVTFRHSLPLADLRIDEFEVPLALVTGTADILEQHLTGGDRF